MSRQKHLTPHLTLVLLGRSCAGQAQELVENLQDVEEEKKKKTHTDKYTDTRMTKSVSVAMYAN